MSSDQPRGHRRSIRLPGCDYTQPGAYFVTICTQDGECLFDDPVLRRVAETMWQRIPSHFGQVSLDASVGMPNHMHGILIISDIAIVGARHSVSQLLHRIFMIQLRASPVAAEYPVKVMFPMIATRGRRSDLRRARHAALETASQLLHFKEITRRALVQKVI